MKPRTAPPPDRASGSNAPGLSALIPARRHRTLAPKTAFVGVSAGFAALYLAAGAPTPLLPLYEEQWMFAPSSLTTAFAAYAIGLIAALLVTGSLSDYIGRRPVIIGALAVELASMLCFLFARDIEWVTVARAVQGVATGAATSAFSAYVVESAPLGLKKRATIITGVAPAAGLGVGALLTGLAIQFSNSASMVVFTTLAVIMVISILVVFWCEESVTRRPGAMASLVPRVGVPKLARREFVAAIPVHASAWMLAGLFFGLVPSVIENVFRIHSGLLNGATVFLEPAAATAVGFILGRVSARRATQIGGICVLVGAAMILAAVAGGILPLLWLGGIVGGAGFGASFSGALRLVTPLAPAEHRAGLFAAVYLVAYSAFGVPSIVAGRLIGPLGLLWTTLGYAAVVIISAGWGLFAQARVVRTGAADRPTGPRAAAQG